MRLESRMCVSDFGKEVYGKEDSFMMSPTKRLPNHSSLKRQGIRGKSQSELKFCEMAAKNFFSLLM